MNGSKKLISDLERGLGSTVLPSTVDIVLLPPSVYLAEVAMIAQNYGIQCGIQDSYVEAEGAFTGEISAEMVKDVGGEWALIGHSERLEYFSEGDDLLARKFEAVVRANLMPILCVGESLQDRIEGRALEVVKKQLNSIAERVGTSFSMATIAYEPIWAIGTDQAATPDQVKDMHIAIRGALKEIDPSNGPQHRLLYGGSMQAANASSLLSIGDVDGGLIGGASLDMGEFLGIIAKAGG